jgi:hypothetical protein
MKKPTIGAILLSIPGFLIGCWFIFIFPDGILLPSFIWGIIFILLSFGLLLHWQWIGIVFWTITVFLGFWLLSCLKSGGESVMAIPLLSVLFVWPFVAGVYTNRWVNPLVYLHDLLKDLLKEDDSPNVKKK